MTIYYVSSVIGSDNNAGMSATSPLASLQAAEAFVHPGDTVEVMNGTYTNNGNDVLTITTSGTASAPITFEAMPGQTPVVNSSGAWQGIEIEANYITIKGFTVVGDAANYTLAQAQAQYSPGDPNLNGSGIAINGNAQTTVHHNIILENNTVYNEPGAGISAIGADYVQILNNVVHDTSHWSAYGASGISIFQSLNSDTNPGVHDIVSGNVVYNNAQLVPTVGGNTITDGEGIILDTNTGFVGVISVTGNTVYNNGSSGIESFQTNNASITNNTVYGNDVNNVQASNVAEIFINQSNNDTVTNNSFSPSGGGTPPNPPTILSFSPDTNGVDTTSTINLTGTAATGSTVTVFDGSMNLGTANVDASDNWSFTENNAVNGAHTFTATDTTSSGTSSASTPFSVAVNASAPPPPPPGSNLVANGDFETHDFSGWTLSGNDGPFGGPGGPLQVFITNQAHTGQYAAGLGSIGADGIVSQDVPTTAGQTYTLDFWLANVGGPSDDFTVKWNGQTVWSVTNASAQPYTEHTFTVTGTAGTSHLEFDAAEGPGQWNLDAISVVSSSGSNPPPLPPTIISFSPETNGVDTTSTINLAGTAPATSVVTLFDGSTDLGTTNADANGNWSFTENNAANGVHTFTATDTTSGGTSPASSAFNVTVNVPVPPPNNLVTNGDFETGSFSGWDIGSFNPSQTFIVTTDVQSGHYAAGLGTVGGEGTLSQTLPTVVGQEYQLTFWLANENGGPTNNFNAIVAGQNLYHEANANAHAYVEHIIDFTATSTSTSLTFQYRQDPSEWHLDQVSVVGIAANGIV